MTPEVICWLPTGRSLDADLVAALSEECPDRTVRAVTFDWHRSDSFGADLVANCEHWAQLGAEAFANIDNSDGTFRCPIVVGEFPIEALVAIIHTDFSHCIAPVVMVPLHDASGKILRFETLVGPV